MLDFSLGELTLIGAVALVVLGPERLPRVARTFGQWLGKAQHYVSQVRSEIQREVELSDLKRLQEEARDAAQSIGSTVRDAAASLESAARPFAGSASTPDSPPPSWASHRFNSRRRPSASFYELEEAVEQLRRQSRPGAGRLGRNKFAPRSRLNRARIYR